MAQYKPKITFKVYKICWNYMLVDNKVRSSICQVKSILLVKWMHSIFSHIVMYIMDYSYNIPSIKIRNKGKPITGTIANFRANKPFGKQFEYQPDSFKLFRRPESSLHIITVVRLNSKGVTRPVAPFTNMV